MPTTLQAILRVEVTGAGTESATQALDAEAYDKIHITVPTGSPGTATVEVQPGGAGQAQLLLLTASRYPLDGTGAAELTYEVDGSGTAIDFDAPLLLVGSGALSLLGAVNTIDFSNSSDADLTVTLLVGRDATP